MPLAKPGSSKPPNLVAGLQAAIEMAAHIAGIHAARAEMLAEAAADSEYVPEMFTAAEMAQARASVAAGLAVSFRLRADEEDTPVTREPWWRRLTRRSG